MIHSPRATLSVNKLRIPSLPKIALYIKTAMHNKAVSEISKAIKLGN